jgi:hypothetical protein
METVAKYNNLVNQHPKHMTLIETLFHQGTLRQMLVRLSKEKIDFMSIPNEENGFAWLLNVSNTSLKRLTVARSVLISNLNRSSESIFSDVISSKLFSIKSASFEKSFKNKQ